MTKTRQQFVVVGISGGVDSAVSALLLKLQHYHVEAVFMQNWQETTADGCPFLEDLQDAEAVCKVLDIKLHTVNFSNEYWHKVFQYFLDEYALGRTPNPDILCNKEIKFRAFLDYARSLGADYIATGHYARKITYDAKEHLLKAADPNKDQTYFLYLLNQEQLVASLFPVGDLTKQQVRTLAKTHKLPNFAKKDSTGICFIGERKFKNFLNEYLLARPGDIITSDGSVMGRHDGLMFYTIGQRQGIGIGGKKNYQEAPWYVAQKDQQNNFLIITQDRCYPTLMAKCLICNRVHWIAKEIKCFPLACYAKIRYRQQDQQCIVTQFDVDCLQVEFSQGQWAITPGQSVVFYLKDECIGGGTIVRSC